MILNFVLLQLLLFSGCAHSAEPSNLGKLVPCDKSLCPPRTKHIGCLDNWDISKDCGRKAKIVSVELEMKEHILQFVNVVRNMVASGYTNMSVAARMPTMTWSRELAFVAGLQARQCDRTGYYCANTKRFRYVASAELIGSLNKLIPPAVFVIAQFLPAWIIDVLGCRMDASHKIIPQAPGKCVGHYIPVIQDKGNRMGCVLRTDQPQEITMNVALHCLFSRANINGKLPYEVGKVPAEHCLTGTNPLYKYLCGSDEPVDNNEPPNCLGENYNDYIVPQNSSCDDLREYLRDHVNLDEL